MTTSTGIKVAVIYDTNQIEVWKNVDTTPVIVDTASNSEIHGGTAVPVNIDACIDSNDIIHIASSGNTSDTRDCAYATCNLTTGFGTWEQCLDWTDGPSGGYISIDVYDDDVPFIITQDYVAQGGSYQHNIYYVDRDGGSWNTPEQVGARVVNSDSYSYAQGLSCDGNNNVEAFYSGNVSATGFAAFYRRRTYSTSEWNSESYYNEASSNFPRGVLITEDGTVYREHRDNSSNLKENGASIGYTSKNTWIGAALVRPATRFYIYINFSDDVYCIYNNGSGWTAYGTLQTGTYNQVLDAWHYNNNNELDQIDYLFCTPSQVWYDYIALSSSSSSKHAYVKGGTGTSSSTDAFIYGEVNTSSSTGAYLAGGIETTSSSGAYTEGEVYEYLIPDGDVSVNSWKNELEGSTLWSSIDEYPYNDSDYAYFDDAHGNEYFEISLSDPTSDSDGTGIYTIWWRAGKLQGEATVVMKMELRQGASTVIASDQQTITASFQTFEYELTQPEIDSITDFTDLRLRFIVVSVT